MDNTLLSTSEPAPSEPAPLEGSINLPVPAPNHLPATTTDKFLTDRLIELIATSYVRREGRFYHIEFIELASEELV